MLVRCIFISVKGPSGSRKDKTSLGERGCDRLQQYLPLGRRQERDEDHHPRLHHHEQPVLEQVLHPCHGGDGAAQLDQHGRPAGHWDHCKGGQEFK